MKPLHVLLITLLAAASTGALAEDGSDRSRQNLSQFRQQQLQIHGIGNVSRPATAVSDTPVSKAV
ncbi:hypothetical protein OOJ96_00095 [Pseudomonas sp. 15FMM2]|uniref:Uncharacterized protein n=1 Tax=Pseudomonas imrae TaxID=2992837 RepID=A0ACC7P685_9PSED